MLRSRMFSDLLDRGRLEAGLESIWDSLQDSIRLQFILSGFGIVSQEWVDGHSLHPIGHRGSQPA